MEVVVAAAVADDLLHPGGAGHDRVVGVIGQGDGHRRAGRRDIAHFLEKRLAGLAAVSLLDGPLSSGVTNSGTWSTPGTAGKLSALRFKRGRGVGCGWPIVRAARRVHVGPGTPTDLGSQRVLGAAGTGHDLQRSEGRNNSVAALPDALVIDHDAAAGHGEGRVAGRRADRLPTSAHLVGCAGVNPLKVQVAVDEPLPAAAV